MYRRKTNDDTLESYVYVFPIARHYASRHNYARGVTCYKPQHMLTLQMTVCPPVGSSRVVASYFGLVLEFSSLAIV